MTADNNDLEIIRMMLKKGRKKLKSAVINFENECFDDCVSRAYYSVFHTISAEAYLSELYNVPGEYWKE